MKNLLKWVLRALLLGLLVLAGLTLIPRTYDVPALQPRANTAYFDLPTGSHIAYTKVPAQGERRPCPVIFLQGGPGGFISDATVATLAPLAESGHDLYLYDPIGSGHSARLDDISAYTATRHVADLAAIVEQIGAEKVILLGQSWGAILATLYVAEHPERVERLIVTGPGPIQPTRRELANLPAPDSLLLRPPQHSNQEGNAKARNLRSQLTQWCAVSLGYKLASDREADDFQTLLSGYLNQSVVCDPARALPAKGGNGFYAQLMTVRSLQDLPDTYRTRLRGNPMPVLVLKGQCDNQPWGFTHEYLDVFPNHRLVVVPDAGHSISIEQPEVYRRTIREFLVQPVEGLMPQAGGSR